MIKYNKRELKLGTKMELEHTNIRSKAIKIAKDHLKDYPKYYSEMIHAKKKFTKRKK